MLEVRVARLEEELADAEARIDDWVTRLGIAERRAEKAEAEVKLWQDRSTTSARDAAALEAEVSRLEELILDWDEMVWREDPLGSLFDEAKRIRAALRGGE